MRALNAKEQEYLAPFRASNRMYSLNRMRRAIGFMRFYSDYAEAGVTGCDNCPGWMERKLFVIVTAKSA